VPVSEVVAGIRIFRDAISDRGSDIYSGSGGLKSNTVIQTCNLDINEVDRLSSAFRNLSFGYGRLQP